jgi:hypothetical protein
MGVPRVRRAAPRRLTCRIRREGIPRAAGSTIIRPLLHDERSGNAAWRLDDHDGGTQEPAAPAELISAGPMAGTSGSPNGPWVHDSQCTMDKRKASLGCHR